MINYNDLIGLSYKHGASPDENNGETDCLHLCMEVRKRLGLKLLIDSFEWVYATYERDEITARRVLSWLKEYGEIIKAPRPGAIFYFPGAIHALALGVVSDDDRCFYIGRSKMVVAAPVNMVPVKRFFWAD